MTTITVITVNYNSADKTIKMVHSLVEPGFDLRIEILDNASGEEDFRKLEKAMRGLGHVRLHRAPRNLGFGRANNWLLLRSLTPDGYTVVANNDIVSTEGAIGEIVAAMQTRGRMVGTSTVCYLDRPDIIWYGGGANPIEPRFSPRHLNKNRPLSVLEGAESRDVDFASGAWMVIDNAVFRTTYLFDKFFFFGEEDSEFCRRVIGLGFPILYVPGTVIHHEVGVAQNSRKSETLHMFHVSSKAYNAAKSLNPVLAVAYFMPFSLFQLATAGKTGSRRQVLIRILRAYGKGLANRGKNHALL